MWKGCERTVFGHFELHSVFGGLVLPGIFFILVLLSQPYLSVVARYAAGRLLFDDPTCFGTCLSIWRLVRWQVHPDIYGSAFYALYALYCLRFRSSEDAISRASLRTLLAPPWA